MTLNNSMWHQFFVVMCCLIEKTCLGKVCLLKLLEILGGQENKEKNPSNCDEYDIKYVMISACRCHSAESVLQAKLNARAPCGMTINPLSPDDV
jgi:hypothetical protein